MITEQQLDEWEELCKKGNPITPEGNVFFGNDYHQFTGSTFQSVPLLIAEVRRCWKEHADMLEQIKRLRER